MYCLGCLVWTRRAPIPAILFQMKHLKNVFGRWRVPVKFTGKSGVIFSGPKFSCALRNTRKSFRELYGTVFGPETFSGLLRNARQGAYLLRQRRGGGGGWRLFEGEYLFRLSNDISSGQPKLTYKNLKNVTQNYFLRYLKRSQDVFALLVKNVLYFFNRTALTMHLPL